VECYTFMNIHHCFMVVDCAAAYMYRFAEKYRAEKAK
jgi:hypothetical protein